MRRRASAYDAVTGVMAPLSRARRVRRPAAQQLDLARLRDRLGQRPRRRAVAAASARVSATRRDAAAPAARRAAAAASAAAARPARERSAVCANPVVSPRTTRMPAPRSRPETQFLDAAVVEARRRAATILGEHLGEVAAVAQRGAAACVRDVRRSLCLDPKRSPPAGVVYRRPMPSAPRSVRFRRARRRRSRHRARARAPATCRCSRRRGWSRSPRRRRSRRSTATLAEGTTTVGYRVQLDHLAPTAVGGTVRAEATLEAIEGRRLTFRVSVNDGRGLVAAGPHHPRHRRARPLPREGRGRLTRSRAVRLERRGTPASPRSRRRGSRTAGEWPASGITTRRAPGIVRRSSCIGRGTNGASCSPTITSVGHAARASSALVGLGRRSRRRACVHITGECAPTCGRRTRGAGPLGEHPLVRRRSRAGRARRQLLERGHALRSHHLAAASRRARRRSRAAGPGRRVHEHDAPAPGSGRRARSAA